jgi:putative inorganic carbon (HCO3(-)) transporter
MTTKPGRHALAGGGSEEAYRLIRTGDGLTLRAAHPAGAATGLYAVADRIRSGETSLAVWNDQMALLPWGMHRILDVPVGALLGAATASTVLGGWSLAPLRGLLTTIGAYYLVVALRRIQPGLPEIFAVLALVAVATAGTAAITQASENIPTGFCRSTTLGDVPCGTGALVRAIGTFADPNLLAAFLLLFMPFAMLATAMVPDRARVAVTTVVVIGYGAVLMTYSRAGFVAGAAGLLVLAVAHWRPRMLDRRSLHLLAALGAAGMVVASLLIAVASQTTSVLGTRGLVWGKAIEMATAHPLGVGLGRAGVALSVRTAGGHAVAHAHNLWLNWLVETGAAGMIALTAVTTISVVSAAELARRGSITGRAGLAALTGFLLMNMVDHPTNVTRMATALWAVLGLVMGEMPARWRDAPKIGTPEAPGRATPSPPEAPPAEPRHPDLAEL